MLNWIIVQCTRVHLKGCDSSITRFYTELARRRGEKVAIVAAARKHMRAVYIMLKEEQTYRLDNRQLEQIRFLRHKARLTGWVTGHRESHSAPLRSNGRVPVQHEYAGLGDIGEPSRGLVQSFNSRYHLEILLQGGGPSQY